MFVYYIMPQFLEPNVGELNELRSINKRIVKGMKRQFKGTETTLGTQSDIQDKYNFVFEKMVSILGSLGEISNQLKLGHTAPSGQGSKAIDRFVGATSAVVQSARILLNYIAQEVPSLTLFSIDQQQSISSLNDQIVGEVIEIDQLSTQFLDENVLTRFRSVMGDFKNQLMELQQRLEGSLQGDMGTGSIGDSFQAPSGKSARIAAEKAEKEAVKAATPKKETKRIKEAREKREAKAEAKSVREDRRQVEDVMSDMLMDIDETSGGGYGTQIRMSGHMPSRFL